MNYKSLHDYIRDISLNIDEDVTFFHGVPASFDQIPKVKNVAVLLFPMTSSGLFIDGTQTVNETYSISIHVYMQDRMASGINANRTASTDTQDETFILQQTSQIVNKLLRALNDNSINADLERASTLLTINSFNTSQAIKETQHKFTGTTLNMSILVPDNFDYCC